MSQPDRIQFSSAGATRLRDAYAAVVPTSPCSRLAEAERALEAPLDQADQTEMHVSTSVALRTFIAIRDAWAEVKAARAGMGL